jgi:hypothetical protein
VENRLAVVEQILKRNINNSSSSTEWFYMKIWNEFFVCVQWQTIGATKYKIALIISK